MGRADPWPETTGAEGAGSSSGVLLLVDALVAVLTAGSNGDAELLPAPALPPDWTASRAQPTAAPNPKRMNHLDATPRQTTPLAYEASGAGASPLR
jgi:hypothetical protein